MHYRPFGPSNRMAPIVGQGTWRIEKADRSASVIALQRGIELGMTHIDTAERYAFGSVEEIVGEAIKGRRDEVFLVSKIFPKNASREGTCAACENSLRRLGTDRLDCYLLHWREEIPLLETIEGFETLMRDGKITSWGVSNFDIADLEEAVSIAGPGRITCNQILYNLAERRSEHTVIPWCQAHEVAVTAYSSFGHNGFPGGDGRSLRVLTEIAEAHGATERQVALAFLARIPALFLIPRSTNIDHTQENADAAELSLMPEEVDLINLTFPRGPYPTALPSI